MFKQISKRILILSCYLILILFFHELLCIEIYNEKLSSVFHFAIMLIVVFKVIKYIPLPFQNNSVLLIYYVSIILLVICEKKPNITYLDIFFGSLVCFIIFFFPIIILIKQSNVKANKYIPVITSICLISSQKFLDVLIVGITDIIYDVTYKNIASYIASIITTILFCSSMKYFVFSEVHTMSKKINEEKNMD